MTASRSELLFPAGLAAGLAVASVANTTTSRSSQVLMKEAILSPGFSVLLLLLFLRSCFYMQCCRAIPLLSVKVLLVASTSLTANANAVVYIPLNSIVLDTKCANFCTA